MGKKQKSKPLLSSSVSKTEKTLLEKLCTTCKESSLIEALVASFDERVANLVHLGFS